MFVILLTVVVAAVLVYVYEKTDALSLREFLCLLGGTVVLGAFTVFVVSSTMDSDSKMVTGAVVGKYHREGYCFERDHRDPYECRCRKNSQGTRTCNTCYREYTTTHEEDESWTIVYGTGFSGNTGSYVSDFSTRGDRLCSSQSKPKQSGFGEKDSGGWSSDSGTWGRTFRKDVFDRTSLGAVRSWTQTYRNPVKGSNVVINDVVANANIDALREKSFGSDAEYSAKRVVSDFPVSDADYLAVEKVNYDFNATGISFVVMISKEGPEFAQSIKRKFKNGKANEFIVFVSTKDGNVLDYADVVTWGNERMATDVTYDLTSLAGKKFTVNDIATTVSKYASAFKVKDFSEYGYLETEVPMWANVVAFLVNLSIIAFATNNLMNNGEGKNGGTGISFGRNFDY